MKDVRERNAPIFTEAEFEEQRPAILLGVLQYNDGYFFEAHETWEDVWYRSPVPARTFLQALIQASAAFVHLMRGEYPGTVRLLDRAMEKLAQFPGEYLGMDAAAFRDGLGQARDEIVALGSERFEEWDCAGIPQIRVV